jgi:hypothetical protein
MPVVFYSRIPEVIAELPVAVDLAGAGWRGVGGGPGAGPDAGRDGELRDAIHTDRDAKETRDELTALVAEAVRRAP